MKRRCYNKNEMHYPDYGGRGIVVCERWHAYENFIADMGPRPSPNHSIERTNNDGDYSPDNCRWATKSEQMNNTRRVPKYEHAGRSLSVAQWAQEVGMRAGLLHTRLQAGWELAAALETPVAPPLYVEAFGERRTLAQWAKVTGILASVLKYRICKAGWPVERALTEPPQRKAA